MKTVPGLAACVALIGSPALLVSQTWVIPVATNAVASGGQSTTTALRLLNQGSQTAEVALDLLPSSGTTVPAPVTVAVAPGATYAVADVLDHVFGVKDTTAALRVVSLQPLAITAHILTAGQIRSSVVATPQSLLPAAGEARHFLSVPDAGEWLVALVSADSVAELLLYDDAGKEVAKRVFNGGSNTFRIRAQDLPKAARALFRVTAGRGICSPISFDVSSGDATIFPGIRRFEGPTDVLIPGAASAVLEDGRVRRTVLRLFNPGASPAKVEATPYSVSTEDGSAGAPIEIAARGSVEIPDAFATLFGIAGDASGTIRLQSEQSVLIQAQTVLGTSETGFVNRILTALDPIELTSAPTTLHLPGVTNTESITTPLAMVAGPDGARASLIVRDTSGAVLASLDDAVQIGPQGSLEAPLPAWFPDAGLPEETLVEVVVSAGSLLLEGRLTDAATADVSRIEATPLALPVCDPPAIGTFTAFPSTITLAGPVDLYWSADADFVRLRPESRSLAAEGTRSVDVPVGGATYTLEAANACGTVSQSLTVFPASQVGLRTADPTSGQPGQLVTLRFAGVAGEDITSVDFESNGSPVATAPVESSLPGEITIRVPFIPSTTLTQGHLTGLFTLRPRTEEGTSGPTVGFTIRPLLAPTGAVAELRKVFDYLVKEVRASLARQAELPEAKEMAEAALPLLEADAAIFAQMVSDIDARGTAVIPVNLPSATVANPDRVTISRRDVELLIALMRATLGSDVLVPPSGSAPSKWAGRTASGPGPCMKDDPFYNACLISSLQILPGVLGQVGDQWTNALPQLLNRLQGYAQWACYVAPLVLRSFRVDPTEYVRGGKKDDKRITALLGPYWDQKGLEDAMVAGCIKNATAQALIRIHNNPSNEARIKQELAGDIANCKRFSKKQAEEVVKYVDRLHIAAERPVGRCELADVRVNSNFTHHLRRVTEEERDPRKYRFYGRRQGEGSLRIVIDPNEFVDFHRVAKPPYYPRIVVGKAPKQLSIVEFYAYRSPSERFPVRGLPITLKDGQSLSKPLSFVLDRNTYELSIQSLKSGVWRADLRLTRGESTPGAHRCVLKLAMKRDANDEESQVIEIAPSTSGSAPQKTSNIADAYANIQLAGSANGRPDSTSVFVAAKSGESINKRGETLYSLGATTGSVDVKIESLGANPRITASVIIRMEEAPQ